jgi:hypothetical protein
MQLEHLVIIFLLMMVAGFIRSDGVSIGGPEPMVSATSIAEPQSIEQYIAKHYGG